MNNDFKFKTPTESFLEITGDTYTGDTLRCENASSIINLSQIVTIYSNYLGKTSILLTNGIRIETTIDYKTVLDFFMGSGNFIGTL